MSRVLKAELLKERKYNLLIALNGITIVLIMLLYLWMAYLSNKNIRQEELQSAYKAGHYGLILFTVMFRRIWGTLYGFLIINMELVENRTDFFIPNTGRGKIFAGKLVVSSIVALAMVLLSFFLPFIVSAGVSHNVYNEISLKIIVGQLLLIWFMTIGCILIGMLAALICREMILVTVALLTLEYFSSLYPKVIIDLWNRLDGYWYFSNLLQQTKNQLSGLTNFSLYVSDSFSGIMGLLVWSLIYISLVVIGIYNIYKIEF